METLKIFEKCEYNRQRIRVEKRKRQKGVKISFCGDLGSIWGGLEEGSGSTWALLQRPWDACWALLARCWTLVGASGCSWALLGGFGVSLRRVWGGSGEGLGWVWAAFCSRPARVQVRKQFHMILPAFACFCLLGHAFARRSVNSF